ncbi:unnamed protein product [Prorocentrum cordatum]|uniref:Uncharacterized protein n=2 Tax=Prorocentrum cordatum TaxID=2364126 RepID=A0ABN9X2W4_9DINO|nr:unnamed protein product [Polarella glacialis]
MTEAAAEFGARPGSSSGAGPASGGEEERLQELRRRLRESRDAQRRAEERAAAERLELAESWKERQRRERSARQEEHRHRLAALQRRATRREAAKPRAVPELLDEAAELAEAEAAAGAHDAGAGRRPTTAATDCSEASWVDPLDGRASRLHPGDGAGPAAAPGPPGGAPGGPRTARQPAAEPRQEAVVAPAAARSAPRTARAAAAEARKRQAAAGAGVMTFRSTGFVDSIIASVEAGGRPWRPPLSQGGDAAPPQSARASAAPAAAASGAAGEETCCSTAPGTPARLHLVARRRRLRAMHSVAAQVLAGRACVEGPTPRPPRRGGSYGQPLEETHPRPPRPGAVPGPLVLYSLAPAAGRD